MSVDVQSVYDDQFHLFQRELAEALQRDEVVSHLCLARLHELDGRLEDAEDETRRKYLNRLSMAMTEYAQTRLRHMAREDFEKLHDKEHLEDEVFETYRRRVTKYDSCFKNTLDDLVRFNEEHPLHPVEEETFRFTRTGLVHFEQIIQTYIRILEFKLDRGGWLSCVL